MKDAVVRGINEDCLSCDFANRNLQDTVSCGGTNLILHGIVIDWSSIDFPLLMVLDSIKARYNANDTTPIPLSTEGFQAPFNGSLELTVLRVSTEFVIVAGSGGEFTDDVMNATTDDASTMTTDDRSTTTTTLETGPTSGASPIRVPTIIITALVIVAIAIMRMVIGH